MIDMDAETFLKKEYENTDNFNSRQLLDKLNGIQQYLLIDLMNKFAAELNNSDILTACPNCENPYPHTRKNGSGYCEECNASWTKAAQFF